MYLYGVQIYYSLCIYVNIIHNIYNIFTHNWGKHGGHFILFSEQICQEVLFHLHFTCDEVEGWKNYAVYSKLDN